MDDLSPIAAQLVARVRDDDPEANGRWLAAILPDPADWWRLCFTLAAAVPTDRTWRALTAWTRGDGGPDTPEVIERRRKVLCDALDGHAAGRRTVRRVRPNVATPDQGGSA